MGLDLLSLGTIIVLVLVLIFGFLMDGYAVFLRVAGVEGLGEILAMSNLVQYIARISNVVVIFALSFAFETGRLSIQVSFIFLIASIIGMMTVYYLIREKRFCNLVGLLLLPVLYPSFKAVCKVPVWRPVGGLSMRSIRLLSFSALTNSLIVIAMFVPFGIASIYPEMRMTSVYFGQLMNFFATLLVFAIQDPISMRLVDAGNFQETGASLLYGRVISYGITAIFFACLYFL